MKNKIITAISFLPLILISANLRFEIGASSGYAYWDHWNGNSFNLYLGGSIKKGNKYYGISLFHSSYTVENSNTKIFFVPVGMELKYRYNYSPRISTEFGIGFSSISHFSHTSNNDTIETSGTSSPFLSLNTILHIPFLKIFLLNIRWGNTIYTELNNFYNPSISLSLSYTFSKKTSKPRIKNR